MKSVFFVMCLALCPTLLPCQSFFTLGANYSTLSTSYAFPFGKQKLENFKLTPSFGYGYNIRISEKWSYQPGIFLGDLGSVRNPDEPKSYFYIYSVSLNQFLDYRPQQWLSFGISPSIYYVGFAGTQHSGTTSWKKWEDDLNRLVFSIVPRVAFHLNGRWSADLFYRNDLTSVGNPNPPSPSYRPKYKGYGVGINLKYQLQSK